MQSNNTYLINIVDEFLSFFSKVSGDSGAGWGVYEGSYDRDKLGRGGIHRVGAIAKR